MTKKTRTFVLAAAAVLFVGLAGGLVAYLAYTPRRRGWLPGLPAEMRYVPADAALVAFADVRAVMNSELRRALVPSIDPGSRKGRQMMNDFAGVDVEKQVDHVVRTSSRIIPPDRQDVRARRGCPARLVAGAGHVRSGAHRAVRSRARRQRWKSYNGRKMFVRSKDGHEMAVGFVAPDLIAIGQGESRAPRDRQSQRRARHANNITTNPEMMTLIRDNAGSTAWVVGQFEEISRRMSLPSGVAGQVPPVRLVSVKANINGGVKVAIRAEAGDKAAADQLRDVVRGFISLARLQAGSKPEFESMLKSIELSGTDKTVRLSFAVSPETVRAIAPSRWPGVAAVDAGTPDPDGPARSDSNLATICNPDGRVDFSFRFQIQQPCQNRCSFTARCARASTARHARASTPS